MKIRSMRPEKGLFAGGDPIEFNPGVNILRGANGIGKTIILEYASLLGHVGIMTCAEPRGDPSLRITISLSESDLRFLESLKATTEASVPLRHFDRALRAIGSSLQDLRELDIPRDGFEISFSYPEVGDEDLKEILADEEKIKNKIQVFGDRGQVSLVQALNLWSRPRHSAGKWTITPRFLHALDEGEAGSNPAPVFYVNTDMYEFGSGLDIRESPKHLREKMTEVLIDRLQLVRCGSLPNEGRGLSEVFEHKDDQSLFCHEALKQAWKEVFGKQHPFKSCKALCRMVEGTEPGTPASNKIEWLIRIGPEESSGFVSSGENQALFLLAMLYGLVSEGSCMLLDEPELHLTFGAGSLLMERIIDRTRDTRSQAIIVTHLPHLHRSRVLDQPDAWHAGDYDYETIRMIYIGRDPGSGPTLYYDVPAVNQAARSSHADVMKLIDGLLLKEEVRVLPRRGEWLSWLTLSDPLSRGDEET